MKEKLMNGLLAAAGVMQTQRHLAAIKNAFMSLLPIIIIGSFCTLFSNVICSTTPGYFSLANVPGMSFLGKLNPMFTAANYGTMNFIAIGCVILIAMELGEHYGITDKALPVVALGAYISLCAFSETGKAADGSEVVVANVLSRMYTNAQGLFVGMFASLAAAEIYCRLVKSGKLEIRMPDSVPPNVARSFTILFPSLITIIIISGAGMVFEMITGMSLFHAITAFIQKPLSNILTSFPGYITLIFITTLLWSFGLHGTQVTKAVYEPILLAAFAENETAYAAGAAIPNIINTPFMSCFSTVTGAGITGGLIIAIMIFSKRADYKAIAKLALPCAFFNINEPLIFGLPIVMNPIMAIPFMIAPAVSATFAYAMTNLGFAGRMVVNAPWTTPPGLMAFLCSGGSIGAAVTQIICILLAFVVYIPFVLAANKQRIETESETFKP
ncbi:PTS sugar transporter subunit IIC [Lacrimispora sp. JR3]|uniref:PTS sugar transporter subunit IIC n=1 Tax=Lacrimispora sinapis TaxID=3111456 RepID=UPI0037495E99